MRSGGQPDPPVVVVLSSPGAPVVREVLAGIEEEGVPYSVLAADGEVPAAELAGRAAARSPLQVGVGIDARGAVCVHHAKLSDPLPELYSGDAADAATARLLGHNAARIVVGVPIKPGRR